ncbi:hypothetical protein ENBRE01_1264 [Enteropsectra breve]|nr:hypothetical protein ENBRE01_1264 [Enteropsectra breve]
MLFDYLLVYTLIIWVHASTLLECESSTPACPKPEASIYLSNNNESMRFTYQLLKESQKLNSRISAAEKEWRKIDQNQNNSNPQVTIINGIEFTASCNINNIQMPDSFDIEMYRGIETLRNELGKKTDGKYFSDMNELCKLLSFYCYLDYSTRRQAHVYDYFRCKITTAPVDRNIVFALNIVYNLAIAGRLEHFKKLVTEQDKYGKNLADENSDAEKLFFSKIFPDEQDRNLLKLFNKMPVVKAAISLCSLNSKSRIVIKQNEFQIKHLKTKGGAKSYALVREHLTQAENMLTRALGYAQKPEIMLTDALGYVQKPESLRIMLPVNNPVGYFNFIRDYLYLFNSVEKIHIFFYDLKTADKLELNQVDDYKTQDFLWRIVNDLHDKNAVPHRPRISSLEIIGYEKINDSTLTTLSTIPLTSLALLGRDSELDHLYTFKLFETESELKNSIQRFGGTLGAVGILYSIIPPRKLKYLTIFGYMVFKQDNIELIKNDPCYQRLRTYFRHGEVSSLPKVCSIGLWDKDPPMKFEVIDFGFHTHEDKTYSPAIYNKSNGSIVSKEYVEKLVKRCPESHFDLIDIEVDDTAVLTLENNLKVSYDKLLNSIGAIKDKTNLVIKYTGEPLLIEPYATPEHRALTDLLINVFKKWIEDDTKKKNTLTLELAVAKSSSNSFRNIFTFFYSQNNGKNVDAHLLERVLFKEKQ